MLLLLLLGQALAQTLPPSASIPERPKKVYEWPAEMYQYVNQRGGQVVYAATNAIFESLSSLTVYFPMSPTLRLGVGVERKVYETRDVSNTWVIEDHFKINFPTKYEAENLMEYALGTVGVNAGLMITPGVEWIHFRKTKPSHFGNIPTINSQKESLENSDWYKNLVAKRSKKNVRLAAEETDEKTDEDDKEEKEPKDQHERNFWDPSVKPRFAKILNPLTIPFRLPFHADKLAKMDDEEVFVYRGSGTVEVKLVVAVPIINMIPGVDLDAGANVRGYFGGDYRVAIMKETPRYAKVRVAWSSSTGKGVDTGIGAQGSTKIASWLGIDLKYKPRIRPIQVKDDHFIAAITDWSFRYDLENPKARAAFDNAVLGLLGDSQDILDSEANLPEAEKTVTLISHRHVKQDTGTSGVNSMFEFLYDAWKKRSLVFSDIDADLKDGAHKILKWESHHQKEVRSLGGAFTDTSRYTYTLLLDYRTLSEGKPNAYGMIAEGFLIDYYTFGSELNEKMELIRQLTGNQEIAEKLPEKLENASHKLKRTMYGRTSFYFGYNLTQSQVDLVLNAEPEKVKAIFKEVFPTRPRLAKKSFKRWLKAHNEPVLRERLDLLSKMLNLKSKTNEFMKAFQMILAGETIDIFVNVYTHPTNRIEQRKNVVTTLDQLRVRSEPGLNIEQLVLRLGGDLTAQIKSIKVTPEVETRGVLELNLASKPKKIYFKVQRTGTFTVARPLLEVYFDNDQGTIKEGINTIHMDAVSDDVIGRALGAGLSANTHYTITVAYSVDGTKWGQVATAKFLTRR